MNLRTYLESRWTEVLQLTIEHLVLVIACVLIATVVGTGLAALMYRNDVASNALMTSTNTLYTVPSLSYFTILFPIMGLGTVPAVVVTVLYALLPIVRNALTGLREVDEAVVRAAAGMGMTRWQRLSRIEVPLAWPVILDGVAVAAVLTAGIATIGAYVDGPGLGQLLFQALKSVGSARAMPLAVTAVVSLVFVALLLDAFIHHVVARFTTPKGLQ
jgi:osmoprotectant transport system permease protein